MNVDVIINPAAGREEAVLFKMNAFFQKNNISYHVSVTTRTDGAAAATRRALSKNVDAIIGYGGDGTLSEIGNVLRGSDMPLLIVPGGTSNTLAQELHIPLSIPKALSLLLPEYGKIDKVDMAKVNDGYFLTTLGVGIPARWAQEADRELKNRYGILAYIFTGVRATIQSKPALYKMVLDGKNIESQGMSCLVTNIGAIGLGGLRLAREICIDDGVLDVIVFKLNLFESDPGSTEKVLSSMRKNRNLFFEHYQAGDIHLKTEPPQSAMADGELISDPPLHIKIEPNALTVFRPTEQALSLWDILMTSLSDDEV